MEVRVSQRDVRQEATASVGEPRAATRGHGLGIQRIGCAVQVTVTAANEYLAIELYDRLIQAARDGSVRLDLGRMG